MKTLLPLPAALLLTLATPASAQASAAVKLSCTAQVLFSYHSPPSEFDPQYVVTAYVTIPARFPTPAKTDYIEKPFTYNCNSVVANSALKTFTLQGPIEKRLKLLVSPFRESEYITDAIPGKIVLAFEGEYLYPSIYEDWIQERVFFTLEDGHISLQHEGGDYELLKDLVVGARINGGALVPVFFQGTLTPITHGKADVVEFYLKGDAKVVDYMAFDFGKGLITIRNGVPFPSK